MTTQISTTNPAPSQTEMKGLTGLLREWSAIAKSTTLRVENRYGDVYAFGSEVECLRLHYRMPGRVEESKTMGCFFYMKAGKTYSFAAY